MLFDAVQNGDLEKLETLLDSGADVNIREEKFFNTALHRSIFAKANRFELIDLLINRGADCNALNKKYQTASELALEKKQDELAKHMILRETDRIDNHLAYYLLIRRGNLQLFEFLISIKRLKYEDEIQIIARAYAELKLKNVPLKEHMEAYLNEILINHDYWLINSAAGGRGKQGKERAQNTHRIREIVENVQQLSSTYCNHNLMDVDSVFLLRLSYILENIFFIRNHFKELPLHHVEFCIGIFLHIWKNPPHYDIYKLLIDKLQLLVYLRAVASELKKVLTLRCYSPSFAAATSSSIGSSSAHSRFRWSSELNQELMFCYYVVTLGGQNTTGYRARLHEVWCSRKPAYDHLTAQNLFHQLQRIRREHLLTDDACRGLCSKAREYGFDFHCSRSRPLKVSDRNRKVFRKLAKNYSRMKELHTINRALSYVNSVVDMKFNAGREVDVLAMKRVVQVLEETIRNSKDTPHIGKYFVSILNVLTPKYLLGDTKIRHYLSHCYGDFSSLLDVTSGEIDYTELHCNLRILRNLLLYVRNLNYILTMKSLMNRLYNCKCLEEIKSYYAYILRHNSSDFVKDLEFAPFLLLEIKSILDTIDEEQSVWGLKDSDYVKGIKSRLHKEIDGYRNVHQQFCNTILVADCVISKIKSNNNFDKIRHLLRSHLRTVKFNHQVDDLLLTYLKSNFLSFLHENVSTISNEKMQSRLTLLVSRILYAIDNHSVSHQVSEFEFPLQINCTLPDLDDEWSKNQLSSDPANPQTIKHRAKRNELVRQQVSEEKIHQLQSLFLDANMNIRAFDRIEEIAFEMAMLEATWALSPKLLNNAESLRNHVPVLTGRNLRNYLTHGSVLYEVLIPNIGPKTIVQNALSIIKLSKNIITEIYERRSWSFAERLGCVRQQADVLDGFRFQSCDEIRDTVRKSQYLIGRDHLNRGMLDQLVRTQSCLLLGHLLDLENTDELLKILSYLMEDLEVASGSVKFHELLTDGSLRVRFCMELALLSDEEDVVLKMVSDFGLDQIDSSSMIFGFDQLFTSFLENRPDYDVNSDGNAEILHYAVMSGNVELLNLLLDQCNDLNQRDVYNLTPLEVACKLSNLEMIKTLTNAGARWFTSDLSQYRWLFLNNDHEAIIFLKNNDLLSEKITKSCINLFLQYCDDDRDEIVEFMLNCVDYSEFYPVAAGFRRVQVLNSLVANDPNAMVNVNQKDCYGFTALHISSRKGYQDVVQLLLANHGNPNSLDAAGNTPLHLAVEICDVKMIRLLLKYGAKIEVANQLGKTPLDLALVRGNLRIVRLLLKRAQPDQIVLLPETIHSLEILYLLKNSNVQYKMDRTAENLYCDSLTPLHCTKNEQRIPSLLRFIEVDIQTPRFMNTPLHSACLANSLQTVRILLKHGANPNLYNSNNLSPLHLAVMNQHLRIAETLVSCARPPSVELLNSVLMIAVGKANLPLMNLLLESGADISLLRPLVKQPHKNLLHSAARAGFLRILQYLLQEGICDANDEDPTGSTPIFEAIIGANMTVIENLLQFGADVSHSNKQGQNVISTATLFDHLDIVKYFVNNFPNITGYILSPQAGQNTSLHIATLKESEPMVSYFIKLHQDNGFHLNGQNQEGFTAIHICAQTGNEQIFWLLLKHGADPTIPLTNGQSILHTAASNNHLNIVRTCLTRSLIDVNTVDCNQRSILHYAVFSKNPALIREILRIRELQTNRPDCNGDTALHLAAENQYIDIFNLLQKRVDNEFRNHNRKRAIDVLLRK
ncbi:uncharacterized protein LOC128743277 [Sabethes cyaneus]|uniref:uncharacterized protein LOC128743277 n=1 Tax=Sabethes cyaneus TaxID=53552 RepID=UPI00237E5C37|nr:uncharacterized protein LOC128743277 [Sabethes cyaneus]